MITIDIFSAWLISSVLECGRLLFSRSISNYMSQKKPPAFLPVSMKAYSQLHRQSFPSCHLSPNAVCLRTNPFVCPMRLKLSKRLCNGWPSLQLISSLHHYHSPQD